LQTSTNALYASHFFALGIRNILLSRPGFPEDISMPADEDVI